MNITTQLLVETTDNLEVTLESLATLDGEILIGSANAEICKQFGYYQVPTDRAEARNHLVGLSKNEWQFYLEPGETLAVGHEWMNNPEGERRMCSVLHGDMINKEIRLWRKGSAKFINPVFESLQPDEGKPISVFITGTTGPDRLNDLLKWKKDKPHHAEVDYYLACQYLMRKDYDQFRKHANLYIFRGSGYSAIMMRYYLSQVHLHVLKDSQGAIGHLMHCLAEKPLMAELWCTLGDCYYRSGVPNKALKFFEIAITMGKERSPDDPYPIEYTKYSEYPLKMIELCRGIKKAQSDHSQSK